MTPVTIHGTPRGTQPFWTGLDLAPLPFESTVSSIWCFAWRNVLHHGTLLRVFSSRKRFSDARYGADIPWLDRDKVKHATGWDLYSDDERDFLFGLAKESMLWVHENFRFCPICLADTYHSFWHQSVYVVACPLHGDELTAECQSCGTPTPKYACSHQLLASPYACAICRRPLAGVSPTVAGRQGLQARAAELKACFSPLSAWWDEGRFVRVRLRESTIRQFAEGAWARRTQQKMRAALQDCCGVIPQMKMYEFPLEWTFWRNAATAPMLTSYVDNGAMYRDYVESAYHHTVQYLEAAITARFPYLTEEYQRHLDFRITEEGVSIIGYQPHLLALAIMRRKLEADFAYLSVRRKDCPMKDPFRFNSPKRRTRQHCRSAFLCVYASVFECVSNARNRTISVDELTALGVHDLYVYVNEGKLWKRGRFGYAQFQWGAALWPEVAGLQLAKGAYVRSGETIRIPSAPRVRV